MTLSRGEQNPSAPPRLGAMVLLSLCLHLFLAAAVAVWPRLAPKRTYYSPPHMVQLVSPAAVQPKEPSKPKVEPRPEPEKMPKKMVVKPEPKKKEQEQLSQALKRIQERVSGRKEPARKSPAPPQPVARSGSLRPEEVDLRFKLYYNQIWERVHDQWALPPNFRQQKGMETIVGIRIRRDGEIVRTWVEKESGNQVFDQAALRAITKANPLPPVPREHAEEYFEVGLRFTPEDFR